MARVLYVSQYFVSGDQPGGVRHWQHCRALARAGHDVTVVTSYVQHKERTIPDEYRGRVLSVENVFIGASNELGAFESGLTGQWFGAPVAIVLGGAATLVVVVVAAVAFPALRRIDGFPPPESARLQRE